MILMDVAMSPTPRLLLQAPLQQHRPSQPSEQTQQQNSDDSKQACEYEYFIYYQLKQMILNTILL